MLLVDRKVYDALPITKERIEADKGSLDVMVLGSCPDGYRLDKLFLSVFVCVCVCVFFFFNQIFLPLFV